MNDPYGLIASGLPPELASQLVGLQGRQAIAQALMQQSMEPLQAPQNKGEIQSKISPIAMIAKALQGPLAQMAMNNTNKGYADLATEAVKRRGQALQDYQAQRDGTPSIAPSTPNDDEGNPMPAVQGTQGNARAAIMQAMLNPMLANNPVVHADLKKMEPNNKVEEIFDPKTGQKQKVLIDLNNPNAPVNIGGVQRKVAQVTAAGADGSPVTRFVIEDPNAAPIAQPVKRDMVNVGKTVEPVNQYTQTAPLAVTTSPNADQSNATAIRGQNMHRDTALTVAGLDKDGNPTGDIKQIAQAIANGQMPPLSAFALSRPRGQQIMSEVYSINPGYDVKDFHSADKAVKDFGSGKLGTQVRSFNVGISHLDTLGGLADALDNGDVRLLNSVKNTVSTQLGVPAPTNFDAAKQIVGNEIVKAIVGAGGGVGDREKAQKAVADASSPAQLKGVISTYKTLMQGQLGGLKQQYEQSTGRKDFDRFLSPAAQATANSNVLRFDAQGNPVP